MDYLFESNAGSSAIALLAWTPRRIPQAVDRLEYHRIRYLLVLSFRSVYSRAEG